MDINILLTPVLQRILEDKDVPGETTLGDLLPTFDLSKLVIKGPRKPTSMKNPCFTLHVLSNPRDPDSKAHRGTLLINFYCDNYQDGNANVELMGPVAQRLVNLFDDKPFLVPGYQMFDLHVEEPLGPLAASDTSGGHADEHFMSVRCKFGLIAR